jgi:hypothetical protein
MLFYYILYCIIYHVPCIPINIADDGWTVASGRPRHANNLMPLQTDKLQTFSDYDRAGENFLRTRTQMAENFRNTPFAYGGLSLLAPYLRLFQRRLSAPGRRPAGPTIILDLSKCTVHSVHSA